MLWLDAHPDLCDEFTGSKLSHACVMRRGLEAGIEAEDVCMVGLRSWEDQEIELIEHGGLHVFTAAEVAERGMQAVAAEVRVVLSSAARRSTSRWTSIVSIRRRRPEPASRMRRD